MKQILALIRKSRLLRAMVMLSGSALASEAQCSMEDPAQLAKSYLEAFPIRADLSGISAVLDCPNRARLLIATDHYGPLVIGLPATGKVVSFEYRASQLTRLRGNDLLLVPFFPIQMPDPDKLRIFFVANEALCLAAAQGRSEAVSETDLATWPGVVLRYEQTGTVLRARPTTDEPEHNYVVYVLDRGDAGIFTVACNALACRGAPLFLDERQKQVLSEKTNGKALPASVTWRVETVEASANRVTIVLGTHQDQSKLIQVIRIKTGCSAQTPAKVVSICLPK